MQQCQPDNPAGTVGNNRGVGWGRNRQTADPTPSDATPPPGRRTTRRRSAAATPDPTDTRASGQLRGPKLSSLTNSSLAQWLIHFGVPSG
jgi:hypothetical protein